jgi:hypothetical protein
MITTEDVEYEDWINKIGVPDGVDPKEFAGKVKPKALGKLNY